MGKLAIGWQVIVHHLSDHDQRVEVTIRSNQPLAGDVRDSMAELVEAIGGEGGDAVLNIDRCSEEAQEAWCSVKDATQLETDELMLFLSSLSVEGFGAGGLQEARGHLFGRSCIELRSRKIGAWMLREGLAPWPTGHPPKLGLQPQGEAKFGLDR